MNHVEDEGRQRVAVSDFWVANDMSRATIGPSPARRRRPSRPARQRSCAPTGRPRQSTGRGAARINYARRARCCGRRAGESVAAGRTLGLGAKAIMAEDRREREAGGRALIHDPRRPLPAQESAYVLRLGPDASGHVRAWHTQTGGRKRGRARVRTPPSSQDAIALLRSRYIGPKFG